MRRTSTIFILLGFLCAWMPRYAAASDFTLFFSGCVGGELEPCG